MASVADASAFDDPGAAALEGDAAGGAGEVASLDSPAFPGENAATGCRTGPTTLCLDGGRFRVEVAWRADHLGTSGTGQAIPLT